jgi:hypothetical protein
MTKRTRKAKKQAGPKKNREWFEQKVAELKAEVEKFPADRQDQLRRELRLASEQPSKELEHEPDDPNT